MRGLKSHKMPLEDIIKEDPCWLRGRKEKRFYKLAGKKKFLTFKRLVDLYYLPSNVLSHSDWAWLADRFLHHWGPPEEFIDKMEKMDPLHGEYFYDPPGVATEAVHQLLNYGDLTLLEGFLNL